MRPKSIAADVRGSTHRVIPVTGAGERRGVCGLTPHHVTLPTALATGTCVERSTLAVASTRVRPLARARARALSPRCSVSLRGSWKEG